MNTNFNTQRKIAFGTIAVLGATTLGGFTAKPAQASSNTWKNIAIGAGVVTAYGLIKGKSDVATIGGIAAVGSYLKYQSEKKQEDRYDDYRYHQRYDRGHDYRR